MSLLSASRLLTKRAGAFALPAASRSVYTKGLAKDMMNKSCYNGVNFIIPEKATVFEALTRMAGINLGCLAVSGDGGKFVGVITERDYLKKVELQGLTAKNTQVGQIMTQRARLIVAGEDETPNQLMTKMLSSVRVEWGEGECEGA
jgi:CBS-domain-containing membrane protein